MLNGGIFALWGYYDVGAGPAGCAGRGARSSRARTCWPRNLHRWDTGYWSRYDLFPHPVLNVASSFYHALHTSQLEAMHVIAPRPEFADTAKRFAAYADSRLSRNRAFARKVLFRLAVPRNEFMSKRMRRLRPRRRLTARERRTRPLLPRGQPALARGPVGHARGVRAPAEAAGATAAIAGATFREAVSSPPGERTVAVTFDDAYLSVLELAKPIMDRLGLVGTVFVPDGLPGARRADGVARHRPVAGRPARGGAAADELGAAAPTSPTAGWEIGSHTCSHPHLTELDIDSLDRELIVSRDRVRAAPRASLH